MTGRQTYNLFSMGDEAGFGKQVMNEQLQALQRNGKAYDSARNQAYLSRIRKIVQEIAAVSHVPSFPYEAHLADVPVVNAWCAPGGKVMVYEGLWSPTEGLVDGHSNDELAAVLAHEIAHATARHVTESLSRNVTIMLAGQAATSIIATGSPEGADLFGQVFSSGVNLFIPSYSRKNESEADRIGLMYMAKAGYDPRAAVRLWKRAAERKGNHTSLYATHPSSGARAKALEALLPEAMALYEQHAPKGRKVKR